MNLYIVRHGETEWNAKKMIQGRMNSPLTEKGKRDALLLRGKLQEITFDRVISSPSERALDTAEILAGHYDIEENELLMEIHLGKWQGKSDDEIRACDPERHHHYYHQPEKFQNDEGETFLDVVERARLFLQYLKDSSETGNILVVTHGIFIKCLYLVCKQADISMLWEGPVIEGTSLTHIRFHKETDELEFVLEADVMHMKQAVV